MSANRLCHWLSEKTEWDSELGLYVSVKRSITKNQGLSGVKFYVLNVMEKATLETDEKTKRVNIKHEIEEEAYLSLRDVSNRLEAYWGEMFRRVEDNELWHGGAVLVATLRMFGEDSTHTVGYTQTSKTSEGPTKEKGKFNFPNP